jgi:hypothetical protein
MTTASAKAAATRDSASRTPKPTATGVSRTALDLQHTLAHPVQVQSRGARDPGKRHVVEVATRVAQQASRTRGIAGRRRQQDLVQAARRERRTHLRRFLGGQSTSNTPSTPASLASRAKRSSP